MKPLCPELWRKELARQLAPSVFDEISRRGQMRQAIEDTIGAWRARELFPENLDSLRIQAGRLVAQAVGDAVDDKIWATLNGD